MFGRRTVIYSVAICVAVFAFSTATARAQDQAGREGGPLEALRREYDAAMADWSSKYSGSRETPSAQLVERYDAWPGWLFLPRIVGAGTKDVDAPHAFEALKWFIVDLANAVGPDDRQYFVYDHVVLSAVREHHLANPKVVELFGNCAFYPTPGRESLLRECLEKGTDRGMRGLACYYLAECLQNKPQLTSMWFKDEFDDRADTFGKHRRERRSPEFLAYARSIDSNKSLAEAEALFQRVLDEFDDVQSLREFPFTLGKPTLGFHVRLARIRATAPTIGQPAPELAGKDLAGKPLKLSDYKGKVVVLHFWASWCPPCIEKIAQLQKLAKERSTDEICFVGLNYDRDQQAALQLMAEKSMNWPSLSVFELGESVGSLAPKGAWPSVIAIDRSGAIRFHDPEGEALDNAIAELVKGP